MQIRAALQLSGGEQARQAQQARIASQTVHMHHECRPWGVHIL